MNREIKFCGKRKKDGTWLFGDLIHNRGRVYIADDNIVNGNDIKGHTDFEVDPDSIEEYIGINDNRGQPLYSGSIVNFRIKGQTFYGIIEYFTNITGYCVRLIIDGKKTQILTAIPKYCTRVDSIHEQKHIKIQQI